MQFMLPRSSPLPESYDLVYCTNCGCAFADSSATASHYLEYYRSQSKYEDSNVATGGGDDPADAARLAELASQLAAAVPRGGRILDVGCGNGGLLREFQRRGYQNLAGLDPSAACVARVRALDMRAIMATLPLESNVSAALATAPFDLIVLSHVLEHVFDARAVLESLRPLLTPGGRIYVEVPNAAMYDERTFPPLYFLDAEHINHFARDSLLALADIVGMQVSDSGEKALRLQNGSEYPAVFAVLEPTESVVATTTGSVPSLWAAMERYVDASLAGVRAMRERVLAILRDGRPFVLWGAGSLAQRLLGEPWFPVDALCGVVDRDTKKHGMRFAGKTISSPEEGLRNLPPETIVLCAATISADLIETSYRDLGYRYPFHSVVG